jgi:hypothetical protein
MVHFQDATVCSTSLRDVAYFGVVTETPWKRWGAYLKRAKLERQGPDRLTDADIAAHVTEVMKAWGYSEYEVERGPLNHWLNGRNTPQVTEFVALCSVLDRDPGQVLRTGLVIPKVAKAKEAARKALKTAAQHRAPSDQAAKARQFKANRARVRQARVR